MPHFAHSKPAEPLDTWEPLEHHLSAVAARAETFFTWIKGWGTALGLLHDVGKASPEFFARLNGGPKVDHSSAGAILATKRWPKLGRALAYTLAGHHAGLPNAGELNRRLSASDTPAHDRSAEPALPDLAVPFETDAFGKSMLIRMAFSSLVDADYLETEAFYDPTARKRRGAPFDAAALLARLERTLGGFSADTEVNNIRAEVLARCRAVADSPTGFFTLTVPTGGGKTLSSLAFALEHARLRGLRRVVYVIPYTSIIEQTAQVFREALGDEMVLEHHSSFRHPTDDGNTDTDDLTKLRLAEQNWDAPVAVTTSVQFFESLFASRASQARKLHNLAGAVIVLDEAQLLPVRFLSPCLQALKALERDYGASIVLCTATQPALSDPRWLPKDAIAGSTEIVRDPDDLHRRLRRVDMVHEGKMDDAQVADILAEAPQSLAVVNSRGHARALFEGIRHLPGAVHLSARMCPAHRRAVLEGIRKDLDKGRPCRLISTQLVEAGVDVDFPLVLRALAGLDSLIQSAGRCNREGKAHRGKIMVFEPAERGVPRIWKKHAALAERVLREFDDPLSPDAVRWYFQNLYQSENLDGKAILPLLTQGANRNNFEFRTAAENFRLIEEGERAAYRYRKKAGQWAFGRKRRHRPISAR